MRSIILKIILVFVAFAMALVIFEILLRVATGKPENLAKLESSSLFLYENKPGAAFVYEIEDGESEDIKINSSGFRDNEFNLAKPSDVIRIAVLGDSQEEALQVPLEDTWQKIMAKKLSDQLAKKVETYNFGISGYGTDQEWLVLREKVWQFSPDMVILAFSPNDVGDMYKNKLVRLNNGKLEVVATRERAGGNILGKMARETYLYHLTVKASFGNQIAKRMIGMLRVKFLGFPKEEKFVLSDAQLVQGPFEVVASQKNPPEEVLKTWEVVQALVLDMKKQADMHGAKFLITVNIPGSQVKEAAWIELQKQYSLNPDSSSPYEINEVLAKIVKDLEIIFYDPRLEAISWREKNGDLHFPIDAHFNKNGNIFMGTNVADFIIKNKIIE